MERKNATMAGAAAAALAAGSALGALPLPQAPAVPVAASYAELLTPIPDAMERLKAAEAESALRTVQLEVQIPVPGVTVHHHHHHHHHHDRAWYLAHGYFWNGGAWVLRPVHHHHHHHHHSQDER